MQVIACMCRCRGIYAFGESRMLIMKITVSRIIYIDIEREENDYKCIKQKHKKCAGSFKQGKGAEKQGVFVVEGPKMSFEAPYDWVSAVYMSESFLMMTGLRKRRSVSLTKQKL